MLSFFLLAAPSTGNGCKSGKKMVCNTDADVRVASAASREVLQSFIDDEIKVFKLAGRRFGLVIAGSGPDKSKIFKQFTRMLIDQEPVVKRMMKWVSCVARGIDDRKQSSTKAEFVLGGTMSTKAIRKFGATAHLIEM